MAVSSGGCDTVAALEVGWRGLVQFFRGLPLTSPKQSYNNSSNVIPRELASVALM